MMEAIGDSWVRLEADGKTVLNDELKRGDRRSFTAKDRFTLAVSLARAARNPALEELYFFGPHPGNFAFEVGNANLDSERALGFDVALRWRTRRVNGEIGYFRNAIDDYIFRNPISEEEFDERFGHAEEEGEEVKIPTKRRP